MVVIRRSYLKCRMRILFVAPYVPSLIRVRPYNFIRFLAAQEHDITLVALGVDGADQDARAANALAPFCKAVHVVTHSKGRAALQCLRALATPMPLWAAYCLSPAVEEKLKELLAQETFDVAHVEHLRAAHFARVLQGRLPLVYDAVDCITELQRQLRSAPGQSLPGRLVSWEEHAKLRRYEPRVAGLFDRIVITSPQDAACFDDLSHPGGTSPSVEVVPNGVDLDYFLPQATPLKPMSLVFSGKMSYIANRDAALYFCRQIFPRVRKSCPNATLTIAGSGPSRELLELAAIPDSGIVVTGRVDDLRPYLAEAAVALCPLRIGVGIQNKVLEAMAMGKAVVATPLAARALEAGVSADCLRVADTPDSFAAQIVHLLAEPAEAACLGQNARRYVEAHHDWRQAARRLSEIYEAARAL
jgi:sugar transferase (PEP-CTERM/EpsH1 system associated)